MIIIRLAGGLGNQIFQLAAGLLFAQDNNIKRIILDDNSLGNYTEKRKNELVNFFDFSKIDIEIEFIDYFLTKFRIPKFLPLTFPKYCFVGDKNFKYILKNPNKFFLLLDGYFQGCLIQKNFNKEIEILNKIFVNKNSKQKEECVIHIRGGDFVKLRWNSISPKEYYIKAINIMQEEYKRNKFYIVTDDKNYAKKILNGLDVSFEFIGNSIYDDFYLISSFKFRILSSSTFALWASALGNNEGSIVFAPKYWTPNNEREIFLPNERRITF